MAVHQIYLHQIYVGSQPLEPKYLHIHISIHLADEMYIFIDIAKEVDQQHVKIKYD